MAVVPTSSRGGQVTSVFGRSGAVVAAANDYTDAQVQNSPTNVLTNTGDFLYASAANTLQRLGKPSDGTYGVTFASSVPSWGAVSSAVTLLYNLSANGTDFDQSGISGAYNDLLLVMVARGADASAADFINVTFNNDSAAHYGWEWGRADTTTASASEGNSASLIQAGVVPADSATANFCGCMTAVIPNYAATTFCKVFQADTMSGRDITTGLRARYYSGGVWNSTAAITRVKVAANGGSGWKAGSTLRIYGVT